MSDAQLDEMKLDKPKTQFALIKAEQLDAMKPYRDAAEAMDIGDGYDLTAADAVKMAKAMVEIHGERTVRIETLRDGGKRVIRVTPRPMTPRKPRKAKV